MLKNRKTASDPVPPAPQVILLYGPPNSGKTTISASAGATLFLDCERSLARSDLVGNVDNRVDVESWGDISGIAQEDVEGIDAVVVDTVGAMIKMITQSIIGSAGMANRDGTLSLKGYGKLADTFTQWVDRVRGFGCHLVLTAHAAEKETATDDREIRPDIVGSSLKVVTRDCTAIGYCTIRGNARQVAFAPGAWWAKGPVEWGGELKVPDLRQNTSWLAEKIADLQQIEKKRQEAALEAMQHLDAFRDELEVQSPDDANDAMKRIDKLPQGVRPAAKKVLWEAAKAARVTFDRQDGVFVPFSEKELESG